MATKKSASNKATGAKSSRAVKPSGDAGFSEKRGEGDELHQRVPEDGPHDASQAHLTTNQGIRVSDNQNQLKAGVRDQFCWRTSCCGRRSSTLTMSEFRSVAMGFLRRGIPGQPWRGKALRRTCLTWSAIGALWSA